MVLFGCIYAVVNAQAYTSRLVQVKFESVTPIETIRATNPSGVLVLDLEKATVEAAVLIKGFVFKKALMQQHFNENYLESDKYPKAQFNGHFDKSTLTLATTGVQNVWVEGPITIHGVSQPHRCLVQLEFENENCRAATKFPLKPADFSISIPALVRKNINENLLVELTSGWMKPNK